MSSRNKGSGVRTNTFSRRLLPIKPTSHKHVEREATQNDFNPTENSNQEKQARRSKLPNKPTRLPLLNPASTRSNSHSTTPRPLLPSLALLQLQQQRFSCSLLDPLHLRFHPRNLDEIVSSVHQTPLQPPLPVSYDSDRSRGRESSFLGLDEFRGFGSASERTRIVGRKGSSNSPSRSSGVRWAEKMSTSIGQDFGEGRSCEVNESDHDRMLSVSVVCPADFLSKGGEEKRGRERQERRVSFEGSIRNANEKARKTKEGK